jgi:putative protein kinase ArgK-like GTPase of G3E family
MNDLQIKVATNGWVITDRYGIQSVYTDPEAFIRAVATRTLTLEQAEKLILQEVIE